MDLRELESYRLSDAVKFNDRLNPRLWGTDEHLLPKVRQRLLDIADDFRESLGIDVEIKDITVSGSNAAYTYTPHSDIDLHLVVDLPRADESDVYRELFDAKKYQYNDQHDFKIGGYDVELYVQNANEPHHSQGIYSVLNNDWVRVPGRRKPEVNDISVRSKYEDLGRRIESAIESGDLATMDALSKKIKNMRQSGLDQHGEFSPENLAFKILRNNGTLDKLRSARLAAKDDEMSLTERKKKKKKTRYGFGGYWFPGYHYYGDTGAAADGGGDGGGGESTQEDYDPNAEPPGPETKPEMPAGTVLVNVSDVYDWYKLGQDISDLKHADPKAYGKGAPQTVLSFGSEPIEHMYKKDLDRLGMKTLDIDRRAKNKDPEAEYRMDEQQDTGSALEKFADYVCQRLKIESCPKIRVRKDPQWAKVNGTFGRYDPEKNTLEVSVAGRHIADVMRTLAHELVHHHQEEREGIPTDGGETGSRFEDEANAYAGRIMRDFREQHPEIFANKLKEQLDQPTPTAQEIISKHGMSEQEFIQQLRQGIKVEMEHTTDARAAMDMAMRHINDQPNYYDALSEAIQTPVSQDPRHIKQYYDFLQGKARMGRPLSKTEQQFLTAYHATTKMKSQVAERDLDEDLRRAVAGAAAAACIAGTPGCATTQGPSAADAIKTIQTIGRTAKNLPTKAGAEEELRQELKNWLRRQGGHTDQPTRLPLPDIKKQTNESSGYIPTEREKNDPRFSMALTVDVKPGETGRQANKLKLNTDSQGRPQLLMKKLGNLLEGIKADIPIGSVIDLGKNYPAYERLHAQVDGIENNKATLRIVDAQGTGKFKIGDRFRIATNYIQNAPIVEDCWSGYRQAGMKQKGDRWVPNCVKVSEDEELMEVEMSPSAFKKFLNSPEAEGIRAGFEAELIFRDTKNDEDDDEYEADYDADERAYSIESVIDFFQGGDGIGRNAANRLRNSMYEDWQDWQREGFYNDYWDENVYNDWVKANIWPDVEDEYMDRAREELGDNAEDTAVEELARENFETDRLGDFESQGKWYQQAEEESWDEYRENESSEEDWLSENYRWMSDVSNGYEVDWPYYRGGDGNGGSRDWDDIGNSLERVTGKDVRVSSGYHQAIRRENQYIIEPDSSLDPDDREDYGLEVVSPPMPLPEAIEQLRKVIDWANGSGDAYTNSSTGIHMGVSLPFKGGDVDPIKLILFMGDRDLLEKFDRASNHYTRSAYERLESKIRGMKNAGPKQIAGVMELMKSNLIELADRELKRGVLGDKYMSVHPQEGYIEFRGPGGDYLSKESEIDGVLENTMLRLAYAMSIAGRPDLYRKEYAKKLYKVLTKDDPANPFMKLFSDYSAGDISGDELKRQWADTVLRAEQGKDEDVPVDVENPQDADPKKAPSRRAELAKRVTRSTRDVGEQLWRVNHHSSFQYVIARSQAEAVDKAVQKDRAFNSPETRARIATDAERNEYQQRQELEKLRQQQQDSNQDAADIRATLDVPQSAGSGENPSWRDQLRQHVAQQSGEWTGHWIVKDAQGRELTRFHGIGNVQSDANRHAAAWLGRNMPELVGQEIEVVPEMR